MKNTQKKLKAKHFRYVKKEQLKDSRPNLKLFFGKIDLNIWQEKIYVFFSTVARHDRYPMHDPTFVQQHLLEQIEYAYVLYHQQKLTDAGNRLIQHFFELQSITQWSQMIDQLLKYQTDDDTPEAAHYSPHLLHAIELTPYIAQYLYLFAHNKEQQFNFPLYILPINKLTAEELQQKNYHTKVHTANNNSLNHPVPFYYTVKIDLPEWIAPQPYSIKSIQNFFSIDSLAGWKEVLWNWYESVVVEGIYWSADNPDRSFCGTSLLYVYSCFRSLITMYSSQNTTSPSSNRYEDIFEHRPAFREQVPYKIIHENIEHDLLFVNTTEAAQPLTYILKYMNEYSEVEWIEILYKWLYYGLSAYAITDDKYTTHTIRIYQLLAKIVELSYILAHQDEIIYPQQQD